MSNVKIKAKTLAGFRDLLPAEALQKERMLSTVRKTFRQFGLAPIETPHLEYTEVLLGKGSDEIQKQLYRFRDNGDRDVTLRFDQTVPLARFVVQHRGKLGRIFKRYAIGNVFRGESPQAGRFREFTQCDFDIIGTYSMGADAETVLMIYTSLKALGIEDFTISINNRKIMNGLVDALGITSAADDVLRIVDKLDKIGVKRVGELLEQQAGIAPEKVQKVLSFITLREDNGADAFFSQIAKYEDWSPLIREGIDELKEIYKILAAAQINPKNYCIDFSVVRGLGYYTGPVFETRLDLLPQIGAVASGGRFDNLTKSFSDENLPGVGASIGIDRLLAALEKLNLIETTATPALVLVANISKENLPASYGFASQLRQAGINTEVFPEAQKLGKQFSYADKMGFNYLIAYGEREQQEQVFTLADLKSGEKTTVTTFEELIKKLS